MKRIYHPWTAWECVPGGMYETTTPKPMNAQEAVEAYAVFLADTPRFQTALNRVLNEWSISCEHFLSNESTNRIAWLGQSSMCIETRVPACFRRGFMLLDDEERLIANATAAEALRTWLRQHGASEKFAIMDALDEYPDQSEQLPTTKPKNERVATYIQTWKARGYPEDIPDEVPPGLMSAGLAPSYRAIATAILKNDLQFTSLGFTAPHSRYYDDLKRIEIAARPKGPSAQFSLWSL